ncbi:1,2-phenylacetyl-CoA epoxidase subunit PaaD [Dactylosporangium sp. NPDC051484]|uniref:1,2-phenylacetyl-CoA epoxidase subunit PaaD n=1 Tax=Dactylosporangium sp. NPDC051484 TaxID=3154942 RepID=UPI00344CC4E8
MNAASSAQGTAWAAAATVADPELPVLTIAELGILRQVEVDGSRVTVTVTPTYLGCPAMDVIAAGIVAAVQAAGFGPVEVVRSLSPAWTTAWLGAQAREKLLAAGIAPPGPGPRLLPLPTRREAPPCPRCGAAATTELSRFGAAACMALWRCTGCGEPFEHLKEHC